MDTWPGTAGSFEPPEAARQEDERDVFLSYNKKDIAYLRIVRASLTNANIGAWFDEDDMPQGGDLIDDLIAGLKRCRSVAVFFGPHDMGNYGRRELKIADTEDVNSRRRVFPVLLPGYDGPADLSEVEQRLSIKTVIDLRNEFDKHGLSDTGLVSLVAAIWHQSTATARQRLSGLRSWKAGPSAPAGSHVTSGYRRPEPTGRHRALLIGIGQYENRTLQNLHGPPIDVGELADTLRALAFDADVWNVEVRQNLNRAEFLEALADAYKPAGSEDVHLLYFSGHGVVPQSGEVYLCLRDTDPDQPDETAYRLGALEGRARQAGGEHVLIFDCCHAAPLDEERGPFYEKTLRAAVFAASRRAVSDAPAADSTSPFTAGLVESLRSSAGASLTTAQLRVELERRGTVRCNAGFAGGIGLASGSQQPMDRTAEVAETVSLRFDNAQASLYRHERRLSCSERFPGERMHVLESLVSLLDALLSTVDREHLLETPVAKALETVGRELTTLTLPDNLLELVGGEETAWRHWELAFDKDSALLTALPWELLGSILAQRAGLLAEARVARIVSAGQARKSGQGPVRNVALLNSLDAARPLPLFTQSTSFASVAREELAERNVHGQPIEAKFMALRSLKSGTYDVAAFFVPVRKVSGPQIWLRDSPFERGWTGMDELNSSLLAGLTCVVMETFADNPAWSSHAAIRELAGAVAEAAAVSVVAVCHPRAYLDVYQQRPATFTGAFIPGLLDGGIYDAAAAAVEKLVEVLRHDERVLVGSPVVVKVQYKPSEGSVGGRAIPRARK